MGFGRDVKRAEAQAQYKKFSKLWRNERRYQKSQKTVGALEAGVELGRRPTFKEWSAAVRDAEARKTVSPEVVQEHIDELGDLDWKEE